LVLGLVAAAAVGSIIALAFSGALALSVTSLIPVIETDARFVIMARLLHGATCNPEEDILGSNRLEV
jgi:hypothetical protein